MVGEDNKLGVLNGGSKSAKDRTSRSGSGIPSQNIRPMGASSSIISNISSGIAQKK